jgi:hypothetical protein
MKLRLLLASLLLLSLLPPAHADGVADFARAQLLFARVMNGLAEAKKITGAANAVSAPAVAVQAPAPLTDKSGQFFLPYAADGHLAEWAQKALGAQIGAAIGAKAGEKAGGALLAKVPFGGLMSGAVKKKSKELGALAAVGGADYVKQTSNLSFNNINDYAVYLHVNHAGDPDYVKALAAAMAIYPDLEKNYEGAVKLAYGGK